MKEQEEMGRLVVVEDRFIILMIFYGVLLNMHQQVVNNPKRGFAQALKCSQYPSPISSCDK